MATAAFRALARPGLAGALYFVALSAWALTLTLGDDRVQGVSVPSVRHLVATRFRGEVIQASLVVLATAFLLGLSFGFAAGKIVTWRDRLAGVARGNVAVRAVLLVATVHAVLWLRDLATHPHAYMNAIWARGGARAWLATLVVERFGARGLLLASALGLLVWFLFPARKRWRELIANLTELERINRSPVLALLAIVAASLLCGLSVGPRKVTTPEGRPNVLVIAADSLRADYLSERHAPHLNALGATGTRFDRAYVGVPRTFPSWVSILTGNDPHHHGIRTMFPSRAARARNVDAIPARFRAAGYHTAVVSDFAGDIFRRMDLGFSRVRAPTFDLRELVRETVVGGQLPLLPMLRAPAARAFLPALGELHDATDPRHVTADALAEIDRAAGKPFFLVSFYSTTHFPYSAPAPHFNRFTDPAYRGRFRYGKTPSLRAEENPSQADIDAIRASFGGAVSAVDAAAEELLSGLARRGLSRSTIVVVTADHGESLYEPGRGQGHGDHLFGSESTRVPLVFVDPRQPASRSVPDVVRSVDIAPTLCALANVECNSDVDGRSLVPFMTGASLPQRPAFAETGIWFTKSIPDVPADLRMPYADLTELLEVDHHHDGDLQLQPGLEPLINTAKHRAVIDGRHKLVYVPTRNGVRFFLYDLEADPAETRNVHAEHPEIVARLSRVLWEWMLADVAMERREGFLLPRRGEAR
jgi:arylsulfatase A-like enzyme